MTDYPHTTIQGKTYTFEHLAPLTLSVPVKSGQTVRIVSVVVHFSCHCFTEAHDPGLHTPDLIYRHRGEVRAFQVDRYELSKKLPAIIESLPTRKVFFTKETNYLVVESIDQDGRRVSYTVFFDLKRARGIGYDLAMTVESAYVKDVLPKHLDKISFRILAAKTLAGQKVRSPQVFQKRK